MTTPAPLPFNANFYITAATVIPVLFLAIAVQGPMYGDLLKASAEALGRFRARLADDSPPARAMRAWIGSIVAAGTAVIILIFGALGEIEALVSLSRQRAYDYLHAPIIAAVLLTLTAAAGPALAFARMFATIYPRRGKNRSHAEPSAPSGTPPDSEPGKTDPEA